MIDRRRPAWSGCAARDVVHENNDNVQESRRQPWRSHLGGKVDTSAGGTNVRLPMGVRQARSRMKMSALRRQPPRVRGHKRGRVGRPCFRFTAGRCEGRMVRRAGFGVVAKEAVRRAATVGGRAGHDGGKERTAHQASNDPRRPCKGQSSRPWQSLSLSQGSSLLTGVISPPHRVTIAASAGSPSLNPRPHRSPFGAVSGCFPELRTPAIPSRHLRERITCA